LATRLSALEVLHNICNMGTHDLPDMYARSPWAAGIHIRQILGCGHTYQANHECPCYNYKLYTKIKACMVFQVYHSATA